MTEQLNPEKVRAVIADAWSALDPADRAERIAYDLEHDVAGVTMHPQGEAVEFVRGGRTLAIVERELLTGDGPLNAAAEFMPDSDGLPDTVDEMFDGEADE